MQKKALPGFLLFLGKDQIRLYRQAEINQRAEVHPAINNCNQALNVLHSNYMNEPPAIER